MLTIPDAIKTLFKTDGVHKNFRAHFPNGELPDITNGNIVEESLEFSESVCSQDVFRFGLCEASVIKFTAVGVSNMAGMVIECGIEIDTTSLTAAQLAAIAADPGGGVLVAAADSDIGHGYYRVPLGSFKVDSCPRNHEAMARRQVTAYSLIGGQRFANSPFELAKISYPVYAPEVSNYTPSVPLIVFAAFGWYSPSFLDGFAKTQVSAWNDWTVPSGPAADLNEQWNGSGDVQVNVTMPRRIVTYPEPDALYQLDLDGWNAAAVKGALDWIEETVSALGSDGAAARASLAPRIAPRMNSFYFSRSLPVFYPYFVTGSGVARHASISVPGSAQISVNLNGVVQDTYSVADLFSAAPVCYALSTSYTDIRASFAPSANAGAYFRPGFNFAGAYDFQALVDGWLELYGVFGRPGRSSGSVIAALDSTSPAEISAGDVAEPGAWWDEYDVAPVGAVRYSYGDGTETQEGVLTVGDGESVYDLSDNYLLQIMDNPTAAEVEALITASLVPRLGAVQFTPTELTMRAWPWIEAGDALEITAGDGTAINTYALSRNMTGVQLLMDSIESRGGAQIEEG